MQNRKGRGLMSANSGSGDSDGDQKPVRRNEAVSSQRGVSPNEDDEEEDDEEEEDDDEEEDSDEDDDDESTAPEGAYDPADYANLPVSTIIKDLFPYITR